MSSTAPSASPPPPHESPCRQPPASELLKAPPFGGRTARWTTTKRVPAQQWDGLQAWRTGHRTGPVRGLPGRAEAEMEEAYRKVPPATGAPGTAAGINGRQA